MTKIGLFIAALAASTAVVAASASGVKTTNLLDGPTPYRKIPVYDQGGMGTCYAYATSQLVDYFRQSHGETIRTQDDLVSTTWIAAVSSARWYYARQAGTYFGYDDEGHPIDAGFPGTAVRALQDKGVCTRGQVNAMTRDLRSDLQRHGVDLDAEQLVNVVQNILEEYDEIFSNVHRAVTADREYTDHGRARTGLPSLTTRPAFPVPVANTTPAKTAPAPKTGTGPAPLPNYKPVIEADNTHVARPLTLPLIKPSASPTAKSATGPSIAEMERELARGTVAVRDNTYVAPSGALLSAQQDQVKNEAMAALEKRYARAFTVKDRAIQKIIAMANAHDDGLYGLFQDWLKGCKEVSKPLKVKGAARLISPLTTFSGFKAAVQKQLAGPVPQPLAVTYCSSLLTKGEVIRLNFDNVDDCGPHVSVIVGQKQTPAGISYLVQNSWGTGCEGYSKKWECVANQGALWIDGAALFSSSLALHWIE